MSGRFVFTLQRVLDWRRQSLASEQGKLGTILEEIRALDRLQESMERQLRTQQNEVLRGGSMNGSDLHGLALYRETMMNEIARMPSARTRLQVRLAEQRRKVIECKRQAGTLERLEQRQRQEWLQQEAAQENALAADLFLAAMVRDQAADDARAAAESHG